MYFQHWFSHLTDRPALPMCCIYCWKNIKQSSQLVLWFCFRLQFVDGRQSRKFSSCTIVARCSCLSRPLQQWCSTSRVHLHTIRLEYMVLYKDECSFLPELFASPELVRFVVGSFDSVISVSLTPSSVKRSSVGSSKPVAPSRNAEFNARLRCLRSVTALPSWVFDVAVVVGDTSKYE